MKWCLKWWLRVLTRTPLRDRWGPWSCDFHVIRIVRNWGCNQQEWGITQPKQYTRCSHEVHFYVEVGGWKIGLLGSFRMVYRLLPLGPLRNDSDDSNQPKAQCWFELTPSYLKYSNQLHPVQVSVMSCLMNLFSERKWIASDHVPMQSVSWRAAGGQDCQPPPTNPRIPELVQPKIWRNTQILAGKTLRHICIWFCFVEAAKSSGKWSKIGKNYAKWHS